MSLLIEFIHKFQNNQISSYLFIKLIPTIIEKGIDIHDLVHSQVFNVTFEFDEWPQTHYNEDKVIKPYNGSLFHLRYAYNEVFHEEHFKSLEDIFSCPDKHFHFDFTKIKKIKY